MKNIFVLFLFITGYTLAQTNVKVDLSSPNATIYTHLYFLQADSYNEAKAAKTIYGLPKKEAIVKARKIKEIFDGKGLMVDFQEVPDDKNFLDTISDVKKGLDKPKHRYEPFPLRLPEVFVEKIGTRWYYSKETLENIDEIYNELFPQEFRWLQDKFPDFFKFEFEGLFIWKLIGLGLLIIFSIIFYFILNPLVFFVLRMLQKLIIKTNFFESFDLLHQISRPIVFIIMIGELEKYYPSLQLFRLNNLLIKSFGIAETVFWIYIVLKVVNLIIMIYSRYSERTRTTLDDQLAPILRKLLSGTIVLIGFLHVVTLFGVSPVTVLTGASIGGVAVAFAAQDSVKNLIGTVVIFLDKPYQIGDWIEVGSVVGTVEKVGFRSTIVRAVDTSIFQIPNSKIIEVEVNNKGLRLYRRYNTELGIRYDTPPELIEGFVKGVRELIIEHPDTRSESYNVEFTGFGDSALLIMVNVFFKKLDWGDEQSSKHRLHMAIVKLAAALNVEFAFPSTTLMIEQFPEKGPITMKYNTSSKFIDKSIQNIVDEFSKMEDPENTGNSSVPV